MNLQLLQQLKEKIKTGQRLVIAVDFDGCLVQNIFPEIGKLNQSLITLLQRLQGYGCYLVLYTARENCYRRLNADVESCLWLTSAVQALHGHLEFDAVNENVRAVKLPRQIGIPIGQRRKVTADLYLEDRTPDWDLKETEAFLGELVKEYKKLRRKKCK